MRTMFRIPESCLLASLIWSLWALAPAVQAQIAVKDINTTPVPNYKVDTSPVPARIDPYRESKFVRLGAWTYFKANTLVTGWELFRTDGTKVELVKDIYPGPNGSWPHDLSVIGGKLYFSANEPLHGYELWVSDGTAKGTRLFADFVPGPESSGDQRTGYGPRWTTSMSKGRILCSLGSDMAPGLGVSDGTPAGTKVIAPSLGSFVAQGCAAVKDGSLAYFTYGPQIWMTDGTSKGTRFLMKTTLGVSGAVLRPVGAKGMLIEMQGAGGTREIWASQGTAKTTIRLLTLSSNTLVWRQGLRWSAPYKGKVWFLGDPGTNIHSLYATDGTSKGTVAVYSASLDLPLISLVTAGGQLWFVRDFHHKGFSEIWTSDGTAKGTRMWVSVPAVQARSLCVTGGKVFMRGYTQANGQELWVSDGTKKGTSLVLDIVPGVKDGLVYSITEVAPGQVLFSADDGAGKTWREPWTSKGTAQTTKILSLKAWSKFPATADDKVSYLVGLFGKVLFSADNGKVGPELWRSDGTAKGTTLIKDIWPGAKGSWPLEMVRLRTQVLFSADDGKSGRELWVTDGTAQGTRMLKDIEPGTGSSSPSGFLVTKGRVYFKASTKGTGDELWVTDGSSAGTRLVKETRPGRFGLERPEFAALPDGRILFTDFPSVAPLGTAWWVSDGTAKGTKKILFQPLFPSTFWGPTYLHAYMGRIYFAAADPKHGIELWVSDGTAKGTSLFVNLASDAKVKTSGNPSDFFTFGGFLYFKAYDPVHGRALWRSDGTAAGTAYYSKLGVFDRARPFIQPAGPFVEVGSRHLYFPATDPQSRRTLASMDLQGKVRFFSKINPTGQAMPRNGWVDRNTLIVEDGALWFTAKKTLSDRQLFVLREHAVASQLGQAMASTTLRSTDPVLGQTANILAETKVSQPILMVMLGLPARRPLSIPPFYLAYYDLTAFALPVGAGLGNRLNIGLPIPPDKSLTGLKAVLQAWSMDPRRFPQGLELSNAIHWYLGH